MTLFQPKVLARSLNDIDIPDEHNAILVDWAQSISSRAIYSQSEVALHGHFIQKILIDVLGYSGFGSNDQWSLQREQHVGRGSVDVALGHFSESSTQIIVPFELKGAKTRDLDAIMPGRHKSPVQQAWEYAMDAPGAQWVLLSNYIEIRLYAVGYGRQDYEVWQLENLLDPKEYNRFVSLLSVDNLLGTNTRSLLFASDKVEKDITSRLYEDYRHLRLQLISTLENDNPQIAVQTLVSHAQTLLDRILFIAFAEDHGLLPERTLMQAYEHSDPYNPKPIWDNFKGLFHAVDQGNAHLEIPAYNGGLFRADPGLDALLISDELCERFKALGEYDFESEVGVNVLGHIFEQSISDLEEIHETLETGENLLVHIREKHTAVKGKRKQHGVVYTPDNITQFIVEQTLGRYLQNTFDQLIGDFISTKKLPDIDKDIAWKSQKAELTFWSLWRDRLQQIRIVDPACGSGAFLIAAFDYLAAEYQRVNDKLADLTGSRDFFDLDKEILNNNLYGVDINPESIEITKLSLWLKTARKGKPLESLDNNLRHGNSIVADRAWDDQAFDWQQNFPDVFSEGGFDVVLGNPPYVRQERISPIKPWLEKHYAVYHGVADLYTYFFELGIKLLKPDGVLGYISSSTFFKTGSGENLRAFLRDQTCLTTLVDFGDLQLFDGVTTYPAIIIAQKQTPDEQTSIEFLTLSDQLPTDLPAHFSQHAAHMLQQQLSATSWQLEAADLTALRDKIRHGKATLKDVYGSPLYGIKTGLNDAFVIDRTTRDQLIQDDPKSAEILKPFLEGKDLKMWHVQPRDIWLIFTRRGIDIEQYPAIKHYLYQYKERLEPKPKDWPKGEKWSGRKAGPYKWFEIQDTVAYYEKFEKPKINYAHFSPNPLFGFDSVSFFSNDKSYILPKGDQFLLGLLNSNCYWMLITSMCPFVRGGYYELRSYYIETLPIPDASDQQKQSLADLAARCQQLAEQRYAVQLAVRQRIPDLCPADREAKLSKKLQIWWLLDFAMFRKEVKKQFKQDIPLVDRNDWENWLQTEGAKIQQLSTELQQLEQQLNQQVYDLFALTGAEIALLEASL